MRRVEPDLSDVQRLVLQNPGFDRVAHVVLHLPEEQRGLALLRALQKRPELRFGHSERPTNATLSLGLSFHGLRALLLPPALLGLMARLSPAFAQGAAIRSAARLGDTGPSAAARWESDFSAESADLVLTLHAPDATSIEKGLRELRELCTKCGVTWTAPHHGARLGPPAGLEGRDTGQRQSWVHFGYRDGLSKVHVRGFPEDSKTRQQVQKPLMHEPGEFVLGHIDNHGANPWLLPSASAHVRALFRNASFGVLRKISQDVPLFEADVKRWGQQVAAELALPGAALENYVKAKVAGRWPRGQLVKRGVFDAPDDDQIPEVDFEHTKDDKGLDCPYGAHIRRMNPRVPPTPMPAKGQVVHARVRPLIRRGMPYGDWGARDRGLLGHFFCASIEQQFEHLLGQWGDRMPQGLGQANESKDPFIGQHEDASASFVIPNPAASPNLLEGFRAYCRTQGVVYLFYPSKRSLGLLCDREFANPDDLWETLP